MDENTSAGTGQQTSKEIPWRLIGFIIAAVLALIFGLSNRAEVSIDFLFFEAVTRQWVSLVVAFALGVLSDRLFIGVRRRRRRDA
jgi:fructose-specific phosphotransferase system IIC component